jgi:predicted AAA+ superfamily ATPase
VTSIVLREIRDISSIQSATDLPRILRLLAARTSSILNVSEVSRAAGIAHTTLTRYLLFSRRRISFGDCLRGQETLVSAARASKNRRH